MIESLQKEMEMRRKEWENIEFNTLYFGGGTPSVLSVDELNSLIDTARQFYQFKDDIELTLEANPDDLTTEYLYQLKHYTDINRFSIGTQSFHDKDLKLMNRRHNGTEAFQSIANAREMGFTNLNIDLIYGVPGMSEVDWQYNIDTFIDLEIPHLSAYHLTFEPKTVFEHMRKKNKIKPVNDEISQQHYDILIKRLRDAGYIHYEVSNFALDPYYSKHNTNYWLGNAYLGIGPSAHSFLGNKRSWNVANNTGYCNDLFNKSDKFITTEISDTPTRFNEYILTSLRHKWGVDYGYIAVHMGQDYVTHLESVLKRLEEKKHYEPTEKGFALTEQSWLISDYLIREFFIEK